LCVIVYRSTKINILPFVVSFFLVLAQFKTILNNKKMNYKTMLWTAGAVLLALFVAGMIDRNMAKKGKSKVFGA